jgi:threonine dehydrogenase-like Zn-dependent dehydrogenase
MDVRPLVTHSFPLSEIQTAFETFCDRKDGACKVLIRFPAAG